MARGWLNPTLSTHTHTHAQNGERNAAFLSNVRAQVFMSRAQTSYQVSIQTVQAVSGVGVVAGPVALRADELHDLVLSFTWSLETTTQPRMSAASTDSSADTSSATAGNTPRDRRDTP